MVTTLSFIPQTIVWADGGIVNPVIGEAGRGEGTAILDRMLSMVITLLLVGGVLACLMYIMMGAYEWAGAGGDKTKILSARLKILNALVAFFILFAVFAILNLIGALFDINLLEIRIPTITEEIS